jgi:hypothetical protein
MPDLLIRHRASGLALASAPAQARTGGHRLSRATNPG